jgi:hypothetical protein
MVLGAKKKVIGEEDEKEGETGIGDRTGLDPIVDTGSGE